MFLYLIVIVIVIAIVVAVASKERAEERKMEGLEDAILRAHRTDDWRIVENYCSSENIPEETMHEVRRRVNIRLAKQGDIKAMRVAAAYAETEEERREFETMGAEAGDVDAMYALAIGYMNVDAEKQFYWYKKAADRGLDKAMGAVASAYYFGDGVPADKKKAFAYAKDCADRGCADASFFLVDYFEQFNEPRLDTQEKINLMERVMQRGERESFAKAARKLGIIYGGAYLFNGVVNEFSNRRKASYCFTLAYVLDHDYDKDDIFKTGYRPTQFELDKWQEDARNLRYNP